MKNTKYQVFINLIKFSIPLILSGVFQQLYSWADAFIVGHIEGENALAAIGATTSVSNFLIMLITGFTTGLSIIAAQSYGKKNIDSIKKILSTFLLTLTLFFTILSLSGIISRENILYMMNTPYNIFVLSSEYIGIIFAGVPFLTVYNIYSALLRAVGNSKAPFYSILISSISNIILDIVFVAVLGLGVKGAAFATITSQFAMTAFIVLYASKKYPFLKISYGFDKNIMFSGLKMGMPPAIQFGITSVGNMTLQNFLNGFGSSAVAAITTSYRVDSMMLLPIINLGSAISTMVAQSKGANNTENIRQNFYCGSLMMIIISIALSIVFYNYGGNLISIFALEKDALNIGREFFICLAPFYIFFGLSYSFKGTLDGMGNVLSTSIISLIALAVRISMSYILCNILHQKTIAYAEGISWTIMFLILLVEVYIKRHSIGIQKRK